MVIGVLSRHSRVSREGWNAGVRCVALAAVLLISLGFPVDSASAQDQVVRKNGDVINGHIDSVSGGTVLVSSRASNGSPVKLPYQIADIKSVTMAAPPEVAKAKGQAPATVIAVLDPIVKQYAGLPADWVVDAMGQLADAYTSAGQGDAATAMYAQINQLYPGSSYTNIAAAGQAKILLKAGKLDQALAAVQPIIDAANKNVAPPPEEAHAYAFAFLVYGQILEAQKKYSQALEAYLTVKTMYYQQQNQAFVDQSDQMAQNLRAEAPGVGVD